MELSISMGLLPVVTVWLLLTLVLSMAAVRFIISLVIVMASPRPPVYQTSAVPEPICPNISQRNFARSPLAESGTGPPGTWSSRQLKRSLWSFMPPGSGSWTRSMTCPVIISVWYLRIRNGSPIFMSFRRMWTSGSGTSCPGCTLPNFNCQIIISAASGIRLKFHLNFVQLKQKRTVSRPLSDPVQLVTVLLDYFFDQFDINF